MTRKSGFIFIALLTLFSCNQKKEKEPEAISSNQTMYFNGDIITMEGDAPDYAEALVEEDGKIIFVGAKDLALTNYENAKQVDLEGKTMVPGFVDGHIHFSALGSQALAGNLLAEPDGKVETVDNLVAELIDWSENNDTSLFGGWIVGIGYDDAILGRHPNKNDLNKVSIDIPVMATHISGHFMTVNSKGLEVLGITSETKDPEGGQIRRVENTMEPDGTLDELAAIPHMLKILSPTEPDKIDKFMDAAQKLAFSYGYTTAQEGRTTSSHEALTSFAQSGKLKIDVPAYIDYSRPELMSTEWLSKTYKNHYRIAGYKLTLDGSPQGRTAWRTQPYLMPPPGADNNYKGYPALPDEAKVQKIVDTCFANNWQLLTHANGDAAIDQMINAISKAAEKHGNTDRRNVLIHGQYLRYDQIDSLAKYDIIPSLFPMHTYYWGDWHKQIIGEELGDKISPIKTALEKCGVVTSHTDAPVALPNLMMILWTTVNRVSRSGKVIGETEKLTPYEALKSITIWGAYQHFEEDRKGTLTPGKMADLVILDKNPLKVDPMKIKDIKVVKTIKEGEVVFELK
ncbi:amidohydrolase [Mangrovimonas sp. AS39]|uniref:amidohydrolase n=1 Tax=Mangrovimonas futianensis TaxID=2895523 RepID=UPI001E2EBB8A|nr:amidohydrolase family protein [Mangrovimonas futianensis]MCF1191326.1 amidohydrolase [Mangrovimonas futianensis]MCF1195021.1 amidohydrolase [Mangrovimonas futianensis]